jgi:periplasmic protein TonB
MAKEKIKAPVFDDIVFEERNQEYGAYKIRKKYKGTVMLAIVFGAIIISTAVITPYLRASALVNRIVREEKNVEIEMQNLDTPTDVIAPPPPPPPPPATATVAATKYVAPVVVDSIKPEDEVKLMTIAEAELSVVNEDVNLVQEVVVVQEEVKEEEAPTEVFVVVEEMPSFPGGDTEMMTFIYDNIKYPEIAKENNIQGRVILRFCVTYQGKVDQISILKGVDPALDAEAMRVVALLPTWKPGKQGGKPVNVWYSLPINFQLKQ